MGRFSLSGCSERKKVKDDASQQTTTPPPSLYKIPSWPLPQDESFSAYPVGMLPLEGDQQYS